MKRFAIVLLAVASLTAHAQNAKPSKEREALRRAQAALRTSQEQQSSLQAEKAKAEADAAVAQKAAIAARAQIGSAAARLKARDAELQALQVQLQAARDAQSRAEAESVKREQALQQQVLAARQEGSDRQQANQALTQLLERSTVALADAEGRNRKLHAIGEELVQLYTGRSPLDKALQHDPLLGLTAVRLEDLAEKHRAALEANRVR